MGWRLGWDGSWAWGLEECRGDGWGCRFCIHVHIHLQVLSSSLVIRFIASTVC